MVKNKIALRIIFVVILLGSFSLYVIFTIHKKLSPGYYRYSIGKMEIKQPILVNIGFDNKYVCPDSALRYLTNPDWVSRKDVYPYILVATEKDNQQQATYYTAIHHKKRLWDQYYFPFYEDTTFHYGVDTTINRFYYGITTFDAYMQAVDGYWYDPSDPDMLNPYADCFDAYAYSNKYRLAVRQHYKTWQIIQLRRKNKVMENEIQSLDDISE